MARGVDNRTRGVATKQESNHGFDMVTGKPEVRTNPSLAEGTSPVGIATGSTAAGSPGAVLGTGSNTDRYTPGIEAV